MAHYLLQVTYAPEAWAALVDEPQSRTEAVQPAVEQLGGTVHSTWLAGGDRPQHLASLRRVRYDKHLRVARQRSGGGHLHGHLGGGCGEGHQDHTVDDVGRRGGGNAGSAASSLSASDRSLP